MPLSLVFAPQYPDSASHSSLISSVFHTPSKQAGLAHERLAIVDPISGAQPLYSEDGKVALAANGEIYNHKKLRDQYCAKQKFRTASDCEVCI